jgi:hypothetical protein
VTSVEVKFFRRPAGHTLLDIHTRDEEILEEFKVEPVDEKLRRHKARWPQHVTRINSNRMPKAMLTYRPSGRRRLRRPLKRLRLGRSRTVEAQLVTGDDRDHEHGRIEITE